VVSLASREPDIVALPASVSVRPAPDATFGLIPSYDADTPVAVSGSFRERRSTNGDVLNGLDTVVVTKAEYVPSKNQLKVEATSTIAPHPASVHAHRAPFGSMAFLL